VLQGDRTIGRSLARSAGVDGLCFVGGIDAGRDVLQNAAGTLKRVTLELGGKSPTIVFADCDPSAALDGALLSAFSSNGEVCAAGSRILIEAKIYREFVGALAERAAAIRVGDPRAPSSEMGPLIDGEHLARVDGMVREAIAAGAVALTPCGPMPDMGGSYYRPAVLDGVSPRMRIAREEVFGPVTVVMPFADEEEAVSLANDSDFGLHASIWSTDVPRALRVASRIEAGSVAINAGLVRDIRAPFGGRKLSGLGRSGGRWSIDAFTEPKSVAVALAPYALPRLGACPAEQRDVAETTDA
jgi:acyl-CoA reductase-like NAD-dependent aldehyde dehydrogenase